jgi:hypothetical protein
MKFQMYDLVRLKHPQRGLASGAKGTVVMAYEYPREGYDVEFPDLRQEVPVLTVYPEDLELAVSNAESHDL